MGRKSADKGGQIVTSQHSACRVVAASAKRANYLLGTLLFCMLAMATTDRAFAQTAEVEFDIPAQTVPAALNDFARQARVQLFFITEGFENVQANAVVGTYPRQTALDLLLAGTGLQASLSSDSSIKVAPVSTSMSSQFTGSQLLAAAATPASADATGGGYIGEQSSEDVRQSGQDAVEAAQELEEILVTGSRIRGAQNASPVVTITRQEIDQAGFATVEDIVENLPQNFGAGATSDATSGINRSQTVGGNLRNEAGGTSVNLRGLGADATLVLVDGRRLSPGGSAADFTNIGSIPVTAIERVEVMTDGASAIYGSDAIAGVVNFILRDSYDGAETRLRYGSDAGGDTSNVLFGQAFGTSWDSGNVLLTYEYHDRDALAASDRIFTASNDLSPFGGTDRRQPGGNPANIRTGPFGAYVFYAIPEGQDGKSLTSADFVGLANTRHLDNARENHDVIGSLERHSAFLHLKQAIGAVELFGAARFSNEESATRLERTPVDFTVIGDDPLTPEIEGNPWFVDPTGTGLTTVRVDNYRVDDDFGPFTFLGEIESVGATVGALFEFGGNWRGELAFNWAEEAGHFGAANLVDTAALRAAVNLTDPDLAFNPFGDGSNTNPAVIESLVERKHDSSESKNELRSVSFDVNGDAFEMSGGATKVSIGTDFREESLFTEIFSAGLAQDLKRDILAVYAEVFLPLVSDANGRMGVRRFEVSLAARYENYSDFGDTVNPKLGILWSPTDSLNIRATWGTSYRAPSLKELNETVGTFWFYIPGGIGGAYPFLYREGNNAGLQAEESTNWTAGFQWISESADGLSLDITYFNIDFTGRIEQPTPDPFAPTFDPRFRSIVTLNPSQEQIAAFVNNPLYDPDSLTFLGLGPYPAADFLGDMPLLPVGGIVDNRLTNLARSVVTGAEIQLAYAFDTDVGSFNIGVNGSYLFDFERKLIAADPLVEEVDTLGRPIDFRARGNLTWSRDRWSVAGFINYTDGYTDNFSNPARAVDSWTTVDLTVAYETGNDAGFLSDTRLSLTTQNFFDEDPPFVDTFGGVGYDATNANPLGRFLSFQITKDW